MSNLFARLPRLARVLPVLLLALTLLVGVASASGSFYSTYASNSSGHGEWSVTGSVGVGQRAYLEVISEGCPDGGSASEYWNTFDTDNVVTASRSYSGKINSVTFYLWSWTQGVGLVLEDSDTIYLYCSNY